MLQFLFRLNNKHVWISFLLCSVFLLFQNKFCNILKSEEPIPPILPILIWWTQLYPSVDRVIECDNNIKCLVSNNRSYNPNVFLFYGSHIINNDFPLPKNVTLPWALFHEESPKNYAPLLFEDAQNLFDITSTFSRKSDFPVPLQYLTANEFNLLTSNKYFMSVQKKRRLLKSISPIVYVQSDCDTPIDRDYLVKDLSKYVQIDSYGLCLKNKTFPENLRSVDALDLYNEEYLKFLAQYKFIISFENAVCEDYITEKFWRSLIVGSVPIYLGSQTVEDWLPNPNSAILVKNFKSMETLGNFIKEVNKNDTLYESFLEHKISGKITNPLLKKWALKDHPLQAFECYICKNVYMKNKIVEKTQRNIYDCPVPLIRNENTWNQHWEIGKCQAKTLKKFVAIGKQFTDDQFEEAWKSFYFNKSCF